MLKKPFYLALFVLINLGFLLTAYKGQTQGVISLPWTGQSKCYNESGAEISCAGTGQDGELPVGVDWPTPRFSPSGDCLTDNLTGLMWAKNANLPNGSISWQGALDYVASMNTGPGLCGYKDWRLPNVNELESLVDAGEANVATWLQNQGFSNVQSNYYHYWSSTTNADDTNFAWIVGMWVCFVSIDIKAINYYVWPVRSGQLNNPDPSYPANIWKTGQKTTYASGDDGDLEEGVGWPAPRFTDHGDGTVTDKLTGLMWAKNANLPNGGKTWQGALDYVKSINSGAGLGGYHDWRLPNRKELFSLIDRSMYGPALPASHPFQNVKSGYSSWSSTTNAEGTGYAWFVSMWSGYEYYRNKSYNDYVWPVRSGQGPLGYSDISVTPNPVPFGRVSTGTASDLIVTVKNDGNANLVVGTITQPDQPFSKIQDNCSGQTIAPSATCTVMYRFAPAASGNFSSNSDIPSNDPDENPFTVTLNGTGFTVYSITVTKSGTGTGTVTSTPAGINCGDDCRESYEQGTSVTLSATPSSGSTFAGWSGDCSGTGQCFVIMSANQTVTATFNLQYTLTVTKAGAGSGTVTSNPAGINCGSDCTEAYNQGTVAILTATPASGSTFGGWSGDCSGTGQCFVIMSANQTVTAAFNLQQYTLTVAKAGAGSGTVTSSPAGINCGSDCTEAYNQGTVVILTATANSGYTFTSWSGLGVGDTSNGSTASATMNNNKTITANFTTISKDKAIVVAGGGPYRGNHLWEATEMNANRAYRVLTYQGYTNDTVYYLSSNKILDFDNDGIPDVDADATNSNLQYAITQWAKDAESLVVYLTGHGGNGTFRMSETEVLKDEDLASWLNELQQTMEGLVTVIYDACESGSFISKLAPPSGKQRITITSTSPGEHAYFLSHGTLSFSYTFWSQILGGAKIYDAYAMAKDGIGVVRGTEKDQNPQIDDNGNGKGNEKTDGDLARSEYIGKGLTIASDIPIIETISPPQTLDGQTSATITAENIVSTNIITWVWAIVYSPDFTNPSDNPVTNLPSFDLTWNDQTKRYEGTYDGFTMIGTYTVMVYAMNEEAIVSLPKTTKVTQTIGESPSNRCDFNSDGKTDILWRNRSTGQNIVWYMNDATYSGYAELMQVTDTNWQIVGTGDFNGDSKTDILWRNKSTGQNVVWFMNGATYNSYAELMQVPDTNWEIVGPK